MKILPAIKMLNGLSLFPWDSHKGYRVLGTTKDYFKYFSYGKKKRLELANGREFDELFDVVLGAEVAKNSIISWETKLR